MDNFDPFAAEAAPYSFGWPAPRLFQRAKQLLRGKPHEQQRAASETCQAWIKWYFEDQWQDFVSMFREHGSGLDLARDAPEDLIRWAVESYPDDADDHPKSDYLNAENTSGLEALKECLWGWYRSESGGLRVRFGSPYDTGEEGGDWEPWHYLAAYALSLFAPTPYAGPRLSMEQMTDVADAVSTAEGLKLGFVDASSSAAPAVAPEERARIAAEAVEQEKSERQRMLNKARHAKRDHEKQKVQDWYLQDPQRFASFSQAADRAKQEIAECQQSNRSSRKLAEWISEAAKKSDVDSIE